MSGLGSQAVIILRRLAQARGRVVSYGALLFDLYEGEPGPKDPEGVLRVQVTRLRKWLPPGALRTHWNCGYSLHPDYAERYLARVDDAHVVLARSDRDAREFAALARQDGTAPGAAKAAAA